MSGEEIAQAFMGVNADVGIVVEIFLERIAIVGLQHGQLPIWREFLAQLSQDRGKTFFSQMFKKIACKSKVHRPMLQEGKVGRIIHMALYIFRTMLQTPWPAIQGNSPPGLDIIDKPSVTAT